MKKLILVSLLALSFTGCFNKKEENKVITEEVIIRYNWYYYLTEGNVTVNDLNCKKFDINNDNKIIVSYEMDGFYANIIEIKDNVK